MQRTPDLDSIEPRGQQEPRSSRCREQTALVLGGRSARDEPARRRLPYSALPRLLGLLQLLRGCSWSSKQNEQMLSSVDHQACQCARRFCQGANHSVSVDASESSRTRRPPSYRLQVAASAGQCRRSGRSERGRNGGKPLRLEIRNVIKIATADFSSCRLQAGIHARELGSFQLFFTLFQTKLCALRLSLLSRTKGCISGMSFEVHLNLYLTLSDRARSQAGPVLKGGS